ncbi:hypothetical protein AB0C06_00290 [Micromonospora inaquosa]|uniref:hypothetical protein n=1 Tax=Micromonospora inaquosa TaxID=2203716 RepID=UPI0033D3D5F8
MQVSKDGRDWRIGAADDVSWIVGHTTAGVSITTAIPPVFDAYATTYQADDVTVAAYEHALVEDVIRHTPDQPWWLAYLDTGAHNVVFPPRPEGVPLLELAVRAGRGRSRASSHLAHRWSHAPPPRRATRPVLSCRPVVAGLRALGRHLDLRRRPDTWTCVGGPTPVIHALERDSVANARQVRPDEDALPPGLARE